ncbi:hypothetical protein [Peribacillus frigoritolerans]|nr:hypothetical protein [Bacillus sp. B2I3]MED4692981.1 hypothetical protein [Peribacillus frigoritolerans]
MDDNEIRKSRPVFVYANLESKKNRSREKELLNALGLQAKGVRNL